MQQITDLAALAGKTIERAVFVPRHGEDGVCFSFTDGTHAYVSYSVVSYDCDVEITLSREPDADDLAKALAPPDVPCPDCGCLTPPPDFTDGICSDCAKAREAYAEEHYAAFERWERMTEAERESEIRDAIRREG